MTDKANQVEFNMNEYIMVRLTDKGREIHQLRHMEAFGSDYLRDKYPYKKPEEDSDGWSKWQMWNFMSIFGQHFSLGIEMPADSRIVICLPKNMKVTSKEVEAATP